MSTVYEMVSNLIEYIDARQNNNNDEHKEEFEDKINDNIITGKMYNKIRESTLLNKELCSELKDASIDWALSNGLIIGSPLNDNSYIHAPFTL
eukprot:383950_1